MRVGEDGERTRAALAAAAVRAEDLIGGIDAPGRATDRLSWTLAETAAHMVVGLRAFGDSLRGDMDGWNAHLSDLPEFHLRLAAMTASTLAAVPEREPAALARLHREAVGGFLRASEGLPADHLVATPWYGDGASLRLDAATALLLGEQLIHGRDLAVSLRRPWPISRAEALLVVPAATTMMPRAVRPEATRDLDLTFAFHLRGGTGFAMRVLHGAALREPLGQRRADCHISFDPLAFLLVGYGRMSPWAAVARGGALAYGRRPWLAFQFKQLFHNP
jgi:hypothetical protein